MFMGFEANRDRVVPHQAVAQAEQAPTFVQWNEIAKCGHDSSCTLFLDARRLRLGRDLGHAVLSATSAPSHTEPPGRPGLAAILSDM
jgi:hypothetical protein